MNKSFRYTAFALATLLSATAQAQSDKSDGTDPWWSSGKATIQERLAVTKNENRAKNVILFIGDGMGISTLTAMRIFDGQTRGESGEENVMPYEHFPNVALVKTYNDNAQVADSAGTASAIMTGVKTRLGVVNMASTHPVGQCIDGKTGHRASFAQRAEQAGKATGVVSTARLTHATPSTVYANSPSRNWENDSDMPKEALEAGCSDIAAQFVAFDDGDGIEVALGGGRANFLPNTTPDPEKSGAMGWRSDGRDLTKEWQEKFDRAAYVTSADELNALDLSKVDHLLGLFEPSHMKFESDRQKDEAGEPSLADMTSTAIDILSRDEDGFFLMVEGGRIDHAHHDGNAKRALQDGQAFAQAVQMALSKVDLDDTLILVTADHSHVFTIAGYPTRGNPILGLSTPPAKDGSPGTEPALAEDGKPYTTLGYWTGPGAVTGERPLVTSEEAQDLDYHQQAIIPTRSENHGGEDVALFAAGPWSHLVGGVIEQNVIYHIMDYAMGLSEEQSSD
ncbi:alkaline phosphatase [Iodidimonas muriae]|uniref:Alkaline phosphatase n=1 Tax=Iodidimonas muriae TaxID=261467 RepID=A0ABQ2L633_9PROT|nr:alkaline phosphatase [Iodidimonas muriae]GER06432.1 alkaline phosphatase [Kordiimonadales bacterium JCM 17843]GGO04737.1 alkaline phosphatase [Iodidimonas muriae]